MMYYTKKQSEVIDTKTFLLVSDKQHQVSHVVISKAMILYDTPIKLTTHTLMIAGSQCDEMEFKDNEGRYTDPDG